MKLRILLFALTCVAFSSHGFSSDTVEGWGVVDVDGTLLTGENVESVTRYTTGQHDVCLNADLHAQAPLSVTYGSNETRNQTFGTHVIAGQPEGCFRVHSTGSSDGNFYNSAFSFHVKAVSNPPEPTPPAPFEIASISLSADGLSLDGYSGNVDVTPIGVMGGSGDITRPYMGYLKIGWVILFENPITNPQDYKVVTSTPGVYLENDVSSELVWVTETEWGFRCVAAPGDKSRYTGGDLDDQVDCKNAVFSLVPKNP